MNTDALAERLARTLEAEVPPPACAWLFGSRARGESGARSDVDVAVLLEEDPPPTLDGLRLDLAARLEDTLGLPVDLVVVNRAPPDLVHRVLRDGLLVFERDPSRRVRFEVRARNEYFDLLPYLHEYRHTAGSVSS